MTKLIIVICTPDQYKSKQGIHLNSPDTWYLKDAVNSAHAKGFNEIYCHYEPEGLYYKLSQDILHRLIVLGKSHTVSIAHPASIENHEHSLANY
jgi:hypothetical protein